MVTSLPIGTNAIHTSDVLHSVHCTHPSLNIRKNQSVHRCHDYELRARHQNFLAHGPASLFTRRPNARQPARRSEILRTHAAASSGAIATDASQYDESKGGLAQYDKLIIGLAVPALGSILLDPIMSLVDTGTFCHVIIFHRGCAPPCFGLFPRTASLCASRILLYCVWSMQSAHSCRQQIFMNRA